MTYAITRDGVVIETTDTYNEAFGRLQRLQPQSVHWATTWEGWAIVPQENTTTATVTVTLSFTFAENRRPHDIDTFLRQAVDGVFDNVPKEWYDLEDETGYALTDVSVLDTADS